MTYLGQDSSGDFNQLSLAGVDFGDNFGQDYGLDPQNMEGLGMYNQLGQYDQLGVVPEGMGLVPAGLGDYPQNQLGHYNQLGCPGEMGHYHNQLGMMPAAIQKALSHKTMGLPTWSILVGALAAIAFVPQLRGVKKMIPGLRNL